jgi:predicted HTH domain antitoxin
MKTVLTVDLPKELEATLRAAGYTHQRLSEEALQHLSAALFGRKVLSLGQAAQLAKMSLWEFIPFLGKQGIVVADYDEEEAQMELETARWLLKNRKKKK